MQQQRLHSKLIPFTKSRCLFEALHFPAKNTIDIYPYSKSPIVKDFIIFFSIIKTEKFVTPIDKAAYIGAKFLEFFKINTTNSALCRLLINLSLLNDKYPLIIFKLKQRDEFYSAAGDCVLMKQFITKALIEEIDHFLFGEEKSFVALC